MSNSTRAIHVIQTKYAALILVSQEETQIQETLALAALIKTFQESVQKNSKE